jgi:uncharacterized protein YbbC (DUF1343 family)
MMRVQTGLESFIETPPARISDLRLGLLCNQASVDFRFHHAGGLIHHRFPGRLTAMFSPQHGFHTDKQDNMIESDDLFDPSLRVPIYSLYGKTRQPSKQMFENIDVLLVDLQDVGTRVYTFIYTLAYCMEAAKKYGKEIIVFDRPNPVGGEAVEGNLLRPSLSSFVGRYPIPMRHGLTIGELATLFNNHFGIDCDLTVIPMKGWQRGMYFSQTGLPWIAPSPNLPTPTSTIVYPGQVIWEGTNVSEGRGTTQPFELFGAPFVTSEELFVVLGKEKLSGIVLRPVGFEPTSNKWSGKLCRGFQIHVTDPDRYAPYGTSLRLLRAILSLYGDRFSWKTPPYEYDYNNLPIDLIMGDTSIRKRIEALEPISSLEESWQDELAEFDAIRKEALIY